MIFMVLQSKYEEFMTFVFTRILKVEASFSLCIGVLQVSSQFIAVYCLRTTVESSSSVLVKQRCADPQHCPHLEVLIYVCPQGHSGFCTLFLSHSH